MQIVENSDPKQASEMPGIERIEAYLKYTMYWEMQDPGEKLLEPSTWVSLSNEKVTSTLHASIEAAKKQLIKFRKWIERILWQIRRYVYRRYSQNKEI